MPAEIPTNNPEIEKKPDNARKFIVFSGPIAVYEIATKQPDEYDMTVDYTIIEQGSGGDYKEEKIAHKKYNDGHVKILKIGKVKQDGHRTAEKTQLPEDAYSKQVQGSLKHLFKRRYELTYTQPDGWMFEIKYDVIENGKLYMIEVEGLNGSVSSDFAMDLFPAGLKEVSGEQAYEGYHIVDTIAKSYS